MPSIDLNCDMGERFGPWVMGNDEAILAQVTSANIACGFHAGDADTLCIHGDQPGAVVFAERIRAALEADGIVVETFHG